MSINKHWKDIPEMRGYQASNKGDIKRVANSDKRKDKESSILIQTLSDTGYLRIMVGGSCFRVHRLIASAFHGNKEGHPLVRHLDDVKTNNRPENLKWGTYKENCNDKLKTLHKLKCIRTGNIFEFYNITDWCFSHGRISPSNIGKVLSGKRSVASGFIRFK